MKRIITATALAVATSLAQATPLYHPPGPNLTYGAVSNGQTIMSDITNPAAGAAALKKNGNQYRFGVLSSVGVGFEVGKVDDIYDRVNEQADKAFDTGEVINFDITDPAALGAEFDAAINSQILNINNILQEVSSDDAYAKLFASVHLPVMPVVVAHEALGGSLVLDINGSISTKLRAHHATIQDTGFGVAIVADYQDNFVIDGAYDNGETSVDLTDPANPLVTVNNDSSIVISAVTTTEVALGYSREVKEIGGGTLYGGLRGKYYKVGKARSAIRLGDLDDAEQAFDDALDEGFNTDTGFGLDAGVLWINNFYRLGATINNINEPSFDFGDVSNIGVYTNAAVKDKILETNTYKMERQVTLEAALYTESQNWVLSAAMDANAVEDALGDEYQWATLSVAYATDTWYIPGARLGVRQNMAGTKIKYLTGGLSFGPVNLDVAYSPETVTIDGNSVPRGAMLNLGLEVTF